MTKNIAAAQLSRRQKMRRREKRQKKTFMQRNIYRREKNIIILREKHLLFPAFIETRIFHLYA